MRIVSYKEYLYRFKDNAYYTEDIIPYLKESKENFKNYIHINHINLQKTMQHKWKN